MGGFENLCLYLIAIFVPPVSVAIKAGCGADLIINILLWVLGAIPGIIHAFYIIHTRGRRRVIVQETYGPPPPMGYNNHPHHHHHKY